MYVRRRGIFANQDLKMDKDTLNSLVAIMF